MFPIVTSAAYTASFNSADQDFGPFSGATFFLNISAASGTTPTLDIKFQQRDPVSGTWFDITNASFAQKTAAGSAMLKVVPGLAETANVRVSNALGYPLRAVVTIGGTTPSFTFTLTAVPNYLSS